MTEYIIIAICAFAAGYFSAKNKNISISKKIIANRNRDEKNILLKEYENFLNYDGSEQS